MEPGLKHTRIAFPKRRAGTQRCGKASVPPRILTTAHMLTTLFRGHQALGTIRPTGGFLVTPLTYRQEPAVPVGRSRRLSGNGLKRFYSCDPSASPHSKISIAFYQKSVYRFANDWNLKIERNQKRLLYINVSKSN